VPSVTPEQRSRRENGRGTAPRWDSARRKFVAQVTIAPGERRTVRGDTARAVERECQQLLQDAESGRPTPTQKLTLAPFLDDWLETIRVSTIASKPGGRGKRKRKTYVSYEGLIRLHIKPALGKRSLKLLGAHDVQRDLIDASIKRGVSPRRKAMARDVLRAALSHAQRMGLVTQNVAKLVEVDTSDNSRVGEALTPQQAEQLLDAARDFRYGDLIVVLLTCGLRLGESLIALHVQRPRRREHVAGDPLQAIRRVVTRPVEDELGDANLMVPAYEIPERVG